MLEDIGKMKIHTETFETAKGIVQFICNHGWVLNLFQAHTKGKKLLRSAITRFVTSFLTLQKLYRLRQSLRKQLHPKNSIGAFGQKSQMEWRERAMLSIRCFCGKVLFCFNTTLPLVYVLLEVDRCEAAYVFFYDMLDTPKEKITAVWWQ